MQEHRCDICGAQLQSHLALHGHQQVHHGQRDRKIGEKRVTYVAPVTFRCGFCDRTFERHDVLLNHIERRHKVEKERRAQEIAEREALLPPGKRRRRRRSQPNAA